MTDTKMNVPMLDLSTEIEMLWDELNQSIQEVLRSGHFIMGEPVRQLEDELAQYLGVRHVIALNSGTDALVISLRALGIGHGDEVITTAFTFFATAEAISIMGAAPVFVDIDPATFNLNVDQIEAQITSRTKAIIPVHLYGQPADMNAVCQVAGAHGLSVIEDNAQAFGARYHGHMAGTIGNINAFSFFPSKNLGAYGDGGAIATNDDQLAEISRMLRVHGAKKKYQNELLGYNSRLDTLQAAVLRVKLPHVTSWNASRRGAAQRYHQLLADIEGLVLPFEAADSQHVYHQYTVRIEGNRRDEVQAKLAEAGVSTMIYYPIPVHRLPLYAERKISLPETERAAAEVLSLPLWPHITEDQQQRVALALAEALRL